MSTGQMLTQRFILNDFCQQLTLQSNIKLKDYKNNHHTKDANKAFDLWHPPSLEYTLNSKLEKQWKEKKLERYVYCYSNDVRKAANKQLSAIQFVTYALYKEALISARTYNAKNTKNKIPEFENVQAIKDWVDKEAKKFTKKNAESNHILTINNALNGDTSGKFIGIKKIREIFSDMVNCKAFDVWKVVTKEKMCLDTEKWSWTIFAALMIRMVGLMILAYGIYKQEAKIYIKNLIKSRISNQSGQRYANNGGNYLMCLEKGKHYQSTNWRSFFDVKKTT